MNIAVNPMRLSRVTVIDDDDDGREDLMDQLREFDMEPSAITGQYGREIDRLLAEIESQNPSFVICDHRLQPKGLASFFGVDVVKKLVERRHPAMLLTMYQSSDRLKLRESRDAVPVIIGRDAFRPELVGGYFEVCKREILADPVDERKPHRSLIRVDGLSQGVGGEQVLDAVVSSWSPDHAVPIPFSCIDPAIRDRVQVGTYLLGDVNIGSTSEDDLYFRNVNEVAPPPREGL
ncbi:hypothetical protein EYD00_13940 [Agrobacterium sp. 33MFTa1.1]|uniref:hypothetical protein n=1 Tax=Agrobacterium sp. 33MFTa1.1 TaxID=1279031 RepID=UPI000556552B|nr:hypothetical protein [Agrobacterium sp. 33MFTa1.1]QBJ14618.1 hypothetical protein EYD00_13940 [Agrobacterium sp. 33MFTa1.1]